ncbi:hypothetical protein [Dethiothermospora halolimnae]|uniref:hypothetical protein n=1 Tax=Dethiothermospora halolimnae TaxID=3114390 RepID=UPI003CCC1D23
MAKNYRGRHIKKSEGWRGTCPICKRTGVKVLWDSTDKEGNEIKVCKRCSKK